MKSVVLCEGHDDLWFIGYYLHKTRGWNVCDEVDDYWELYQIPKLNKRQSVEYFVKNDDTVAIWNVGGKDCLKSSMEAIFKKYLPEFPLDPIDSVVIVRDRDDESIESVLAEIKTGLPEELVLSNKQVSVYSFYSKGVNASCSVLPVVIPFEETGAIETILMDSIKESGEDGSRVVEGANSYIEAMVNPPLRNYLKQRREKLKARYSAVIAVVNPTHSTRTFQDMVMGTPWETSESVKAHFDIIADAVSLSSHAVLP